MEVFYYHNLQTFLCGSLNSLRVPFANYELAKKGVTYPHFCYFFGPPAFDVSQRKRNAVVITYSAIHSIILNSFASPVFVTGSVMMMMLAKEGISMECHRQTTHSRVFIGT